MHDMHDECAVFGIFGSEQAAYDTYDALYMQNHRGLEASGMVTTNGSRFATHRGLGTVRHVYTPDILTSLQGTAAIGHDRYSTCGANLEANIQPFIVQSKSGIEFAVASNGDVPDYPALRQRVVEAGYPVVSENDGELIGWYVAWGLDQTGDIVLAMKWAMAQLVASAFSCVLLTRTALYAMRDPQGFRPMCLGRRGDAYVIASETVAFDILQARYIRDVPLGAVVEITAAGERTYPCIPAAPSHCIFEFIYFARSDSRIFGGHSVAMVRRAFGRALWHERPVEADVVIGVPDSGLDAALGFSQESQIRYDIGLVRSHMAGREFILPSQELRDTETRYKHNPIQAVLEGKRVVVVDDSIVRGTASRKLVRMIRNAGAREVHFRSASPPIIGPCFFGIDTPKLEKLIAHTKSVSEIEAFIEADTLAYLSREAQLPCVPHKSSSLCTGCFTRHYPVPLPPDKQYAMLPV